MLQKLNERIQGVVAWLVVIVIALTFTLFGVDYFFQSKQGSQKIAEVNGAPIEKQQFEVTYRRFRQQRDPSQLSADSEKQLKQQVLEEMIGNEVTLQAAIKSGFFVAKSEADAAIVNIPQFQEDGTFSQERYQQAISGAMYTHETFQKQVQQGMLLNQQRFSFIGNSFALPNEIQRFVKLFMQTRSYHYALIPANDFIPDTTVTPGEVNTYYLNHQKDFLSPEKVSIDYVTLSLSEIKSGIKVDDATVKKYFDENKGNFLSPAKWQVAHILFAFPVDADTSAQKRIETKAQDAYKLLQKNPTMFPSMVKTISDDKLSVTSDGVLPWIVAGETEFDSMLTRLKQVGQISEPVKTSRGYEIFKLVSYKPSVLKPFDSVENQIRTQLVNDLGQQRYMQYLEQLSDLSYQTPDTLKPVIEALKLPLQQAKPFSRQGGDVPLTKNPRVINAAFSHDVLDLGNNSEPIQIDPNTVVVIRVNEHQPEKELPLSAVAATIKHQIALDKAKKLAETFGKNYIAHMEKNNNAAELTEKSEKPLIWTDVKKVMRDTDKASPAINELAFGVPKVGVLDGMSLPNGDYVIVKLDAVHDGIIQNLDNEQQTSLIQQMETSYGIMDYDVYVNDLMKNAKIKRWN